MDVQRIGNYRKEIMGLAAAWIFLYHVWDPVCNEKMFWLLREIEWLIQGLGYCGVEIFLFLSGMGLVFAVHKENTKTFYFRRWKRVYPSFFIWFTLSTLIRSDKMTFIEYLGRITFYSNWAEDLLIYKWYVAAILLLYLCFPIYYYIFKRQKKCVFFTFMIIIVENILLTAFGSFVRSDLFLLLDRIPVFLVGILTGELCLERKKILNFKFKKIHWILIFILMFGVLESDFFLHLRDLSSGGERIKNMLNLVIAVGICVVGAKLLDVLSQYRWGKGIGRLLTFLGSLSLEFYLTHELISLKVKSYNLQLVNWNIINQLLVLIICFCLSLAAAWIIKKIVDIVEQLLMCICRTVKIL